MGENDMQTGKICLQTRSGGLITCLDNASKNLMNAGLYLLPDEGSLEPPWLKACFASWDLFFAQRTVSFFWSCSGILLVLFGKFKTRAEEDQKKTKRKPF